MLDLSQAPVVVDSQVLSRLRIQLRSDKKCFTGKEFVGKVMEIGRGALAEAMDNGVEAEGSLGPGSHVLSPTGQPIEYNEEYACAVAQYLLDEQILMHVTDMPSLSDGSSILLTPDRNTDEEDGVGNLATSYETKELTDSIRPLGVNSAVSFASGVSETPSALDSPVHGRQSAGSSRRTPGVTSQERFSVGSGQGFAGPQRYPYPPRSSNRRQSRHQHLDRPQFIATSTVFYKFAASEDSEFVFFQSQILASSLHVSSHLSPLTPSANSSGGGGGGGGGGGRHPSTDGMLRSPGGSPQQALREENRDFDSARQGTLCLVYDLLTQRARKEKVAKQFIASPMVQEQRRQAGGTNCELIFKM